MTLPNAISIELAQRLAQGESLEEALNGVDHPHNPANQAAWADAHRHLRERAEALAQEEARQRSES